MMGTITIVRDYQHPDGYLFWEGDTFLVMGTSDNGEVEVKVGGEYVWLPASVALAKESR
jgi:hypothetical protein